MCKFNRNRALSIFRGSTNLITITRWVMQFWDTYPTQLMFRNIIANISQMTEDKAALQLTSRRKYYMRFRLIYLQLVLWCGVPHGSVLWPVLFVLCTVDLLANCSSTWLRTSFVRRWQAAVGISQLTCVMPVFEQMFRVSVILTVRWPQIG